MANTSVFAVYATREQVERTVDALRAKGFRATDVSVLWPENVGSKDLGHEMHTKAPEGATAGAGTGAIIGGTLGWLAGIGALAIPGVGPLIAAGPIMAALSGAAIGGTTGGVVGGLIGLGIPEIEAKRYEDKLKKGNYLISVHAHDDEQEDKAKDIFRAANAEDITTSSMSHAPAATH